MGDSLVALESALGQFDGAAALTACEALRADGGDLDPCAEAGRVRALWLLRRWDEGRAELAKLSAVQESVHVELARGIVALGQPDDPMFMALDHGAALRDADRALAAFRAAGELALGNAEALAGQATALRMSGQVDEALRLLDHTDVAWTTSPAVRVERALCLAERGEVSAALRSVGRGFDFDRADVRRSIVRAKLLQIGTITSADAAASADDLRRQFPGHAGALEAHGWALTARQSYGAAGEVFRKSMAIDSSRPGSVLGMVTTMVAQRDFTAARELTETALRRDPMSPQLNLCRARVLEAEEAPPPKTIEAYRRVLDADPRMFGAHLQLAGTLVDLNRRTEAQEVIAAFQRQYPHHPDAVHASNLLEEPWRMPERSKIRTRIDRPWLEERDKPERVLDHLAGEVAQQWQLPRTATERLRDRVEAKQDALLEQAFTYESYYLYRRNSYQAVATRRLTGKLWRGLGYLLTWLSASTVVAAMPWLIWLITEAAGLPDGWRWTLAIGVPVALLALVAIIETYLLIVDIPILHMDVPELAVTVFVLCVPSAAVWQCIAWNGPLPGIILGSSVSAVFAASYKIGRRLSLDIQFEQSMTQHAFDEWLEYLYGAGILPLAAEVGGELSSPYGTVLPSSSKTVSEAVVDIDTQATKELRQLLRQRSKGSFALAGPRGAGKSTLLGRWCAGQLLRETGAQEARMDLTVRVEAPVGYQSKDFLTHLFGRLCDEVEEYATTHDLAISTRRHRSAGRAKRSVLRQVFRGGTGSDSRHSPGQRVLTAADLRHLARGERDKLRFLQSHTTEGELSLGVPSLSGTALKRKSSVKRDDVPLNHPQLVDRFRAFLGLAAEVVRDLDGKVLIGIDELDRISDGEGAQQFLNELKAVFNLPNCYFLVSVSEDALADFELSAMGMRTVFDSAFDTIVRVDYLTFDQAKLLLNRRVVDLPEQFSALAYVVSGGLARELIRLSEVIIDHKPSEKLELAMAAARLVRRQLGRTTRAAMDRLSRSPDRRAGAALIPVLDEDPVDELTGELLRTFAARIAATGTDDEEPGFVAGIRLDVAVMAEYLAVLLDVFDNRLDEPRMAVGAVRGPGGFETLARARRYLGANPYGARELITAFRKAWESLANRDRADQQD
ncbi:tetratricopeptide repeat protein [Amycolatopsis sp. NPDC049688]|uniref:tetratricopeptide repeat protein n=1 Tax=Amycolatopsis sp. NPDC049688 TaxID=3154733 RepID=UPI00341E4E3A